MRLKSESMHAVFATQSFPEPQYSACQNVPRRKMTTLVFPGLHHISLRILHFPFSAERDMPATNLVHILLNLLPGWWPSNNSFLLIIHCRISSRTCKEINFSCVRSE